MLQHFQRKPFDRPDGWRVKNIDAVYAVIPFIMRTRLDAQNSVTDDIDLDRLNSFIRSHKEEIPGLSTMHVIMAAFVRTLSQRPHLNRFVVWNKIFARNSITISLMVKRAMQDDGEETLVKTEFDPADTLAEVTRKLDAEILKSKPQNQTNDTDTIARLFRLIPAWIVRIVVYLLRKMDDFGILPKMILNASPFHCSVFITNMASLRCKPIYHHLYEFGTCSLFCAIGKPEHTVHTDGKQIQARRSLGLKFVMDERIVDGFYYASSMRTLFSYINNPERLLTPPETVIADSGVGRPRMNP